MTLLKAGIMYRLGRAPVKEEIPEILSTFGIKNLFTSFSPFDGCHNGLM